MLTIHKYRINIKDHQKVKVSAGARVIHVGPDPYGTPCIWAEVDPSFCRRVVDIFVVGTGHLVPDGASHIGSFVTGGVAWHFYSPQLKKRGEKP